MKSGHRSRVLHTITGWLALSTAVLLFSNPTIAQTVHFVDIDAPPGGDGTSWGTAFDDLQDALWIAEPSDEVWVAEGTYIPAESGADRSMCFFIGPGVALYGGFAGDETQREERNWGLYPTILSGDLNRDDGPDFSNTGDNCFHVVVTPELSDPLILDGFRIEAGNANGVQVEHQKGGGIWIQGSDVVLQNLIVTQNQALSGAGVYGGPGVVAHVNTCVIAGNLATERGGGVLAEESQMTLTNSTVQANTSGLNGAGLYIDSADASLTGCNVLENETEELGGGLALQFATLNAQDSAFDLNVAFAGGALLAEVSTATFTDCAFDGNVATASSTQTSAMSITARSELHVTGCEFRNHAGTIGVYNESSITLDNALFARSWLSRSPAVYLYEQASLTMSQCSFEETLSEGSYVHAEFESAVGISDCEFEPNESTAISISESESFRLESCGFVGVPEAVSCYRVTLVEISDCSFSEGATLYGPSALYLRECPQSLVTNCMFRDNLAFNTYPGSGAAVRVSHNYEAQSTEFRNCTFLRNRMTAGGGGAISVGGDGLMNFINCRFIENNASEGGAALIGYRIESHFIGCEFFRNRAEETGGAIHADLDEYSDFGLDIVSCTFVDNEAGDDAAISVIESDEPNSIVNSIVWGSGHDPLAGPEWTMTYCCAEGPVVGSTNINTEPLFVDRHDGDLQLRAGSPCIDAGNNGPAQQLETDVLGNPRFHDDPSMVDTGIGTAPIVDIGAAEFQSDSRDNVLRMEATPWPLRSGRSARLSLRSGREFDDAWMLYSTAGIGFQYIDALQLNIDLASPKPIGPNKRTNLNGDATWSSTVPAGAQGIEVWFQGVQVLRKTGVRTTTIE